jgi:hypothetical protein
MIQDIIKLKHGRRVTQYGIVSMTQVLNTLLHANAQKTVKLDKAIKVHIAETLNLMYYYKHHNVMQVFAKSEIDFGSSKHLFNYYVYQLASGNN